MSRFSTSARNLEYGDGKGISGLPSLRHATGDACGNQYLCIVIKNTSIMSVGEFKNFLEENNVPDDLEIDVWNIHYGWTGLERLRVCEFADGSRPVLSING